MGAMTFMLRSYSELQKLSTFKDRYEYLRLRGKVGESSFGFDRYLNQILYKSRQWLVARDKVIIRDEGCDLGIAGYEIEAGKIMVHHMNPISVEDIETENGDIYDPRFLICVSQATHLAIHYGNETLLPQIPIVRRPDDTIPWR